MIAACLLVGCGEAGGPLDELGEAAEGVEIVGPRGELKVGLPGARDRVQVVELTDGSVGYVLTRLGSGRNRLLTADEFSRFLYESRTRTGWVERVFNITSPVGIIWVSLGLLGQVLFTGRMLVQWAASERSKRSVVPVAFWWMSLIGASMLLVYFIWRRDVVGVLGQATGWGIYIRNLVLIHRAKA
ncbi:MAG: lipid-A-disaccharide synthase N-terminal domain-containing protein [Chthoniobacterales bacterium]